LRQCEYCKFSSVWGKISHNSKKNLRVHFHCWVWSNFINVIPKKTFQRYSLAYPFETIVLEASIVCRVIYAMRYYISAMKRRPFLFLRSVDFIESKYKMLIPLTHIDKGFLTHQVNAIDTTDASFSMEDVVGQIFCFRCHNLCHFRSLCWKNELSWWFDACLFHFVNIIRMSWRWLIWWPLSLWIEDGDLDKRLSWKYMRTTKIRLSYGSGVTVS
jgi:hypothetical protein